MFRPKKDCLLRLTRHAVREDITVLGSCSMTDVGDHAMGENGKQNQPEYVCYLGVRKAILSPLNQPPWPMYLNPRVSV